MPGAFRGPGLFRQCFTFSFGREPDQAEASDVNKADDGAGFGVAAVKTLHQRTHLQGTDSGEDTASLEGQALARRAYAGGK